MTRADQKREGAELSRAFMLLQELPCHAHLAIPALIQASTQASITLLTTWLKLLTKEKQAARNDYEEICHRSGYC